MKTYTTSQAQNFTIDYASAIFSGSGHQKINVHVISESGDKKEFDHTTNNMPDFDKANELEGQEKYEALFEIIENDLDGEIAEWLYELTVEPVISYRVQLNKKANGSTEIKSFNDLKEAFEYFSNLDVSDLEDTNGESDEYELVTLVDGKLADWDKEDLKTIGWAENTWVIRGKITR
ncbi:MAG: hypothetical protein ACOH1X_02840 [Kaistella sp.]